MRSKLLAVAIAAGLGVTSFHVVADPAPAQSTKSSQAQASAQATEIEALKAQLQALQAKVIELEQRTDAQSDINVSTGQAVEQVQKQVAATDAQRARLKRAVLAAAVGSAAAGTAAVASGTGASATTAGVGLGTKIAIAVFAVVTVGGGAWLATHAAPGTARGGDGAGQRPDGAERGRGESRRGATRSGL